jgi:hypothetical protein
MAKRAPPVNAGFGCRCGIWPLPSSLGCCPALQMATRTSAYMTKMIESD